MGREDGRVNLTKRYIDAAKYEGIADKNTEDVRWDSEIRGFGLRLYASGTKAFVIRYRRDGQRKAYTLGQYPLMTLAQARTQALQKLGAIHDKSIQADPSADKKREANADTVSDLCALYIKRHVPTKKSGSDDLSRINRYILPEWGTRLVKSIKRPDVARLHQRIGADLGKPYEANRVLALISVLVEKGQEWGVVPESYVNPAKNVQTFKEKKRDRWLQRSEISYLAKAADLEQNIYGRALIWLYLLTGARKSEFLKAKWADVDFEKAVLKLHDTKAGRQHDVSLPVQALAILDDLPRQHGNPYVFPGNKAGAPLVNIGKLWRRVRDSATLIMWKEDPEIAKVIVALEVQKKASLGGNNAFVRCKDVEKFLGKELPRGLRDVRIHDLRHTFASWLACSGASLPIIGKALDHSNPSTTARYAHLSEDPVRAVVEKHGQEIMEAAKTLRLVK